MDMSPHDVSALRQELQQMRGETARELRRMRDGSDKAHREMRKEMQAGFARLETTTHRRLDNHGDRIRQLEITQAETGDHADDYEDLDERVRALEIWRGWLTGLSAAAGSLAGWATQFFGGGE